jgi:hypothetical protein
MGKTFAAWETKTRPDACRLRSDDGVLTITLLHGATGLYVQRVVQRARQHL